MNHEICNTKCKYGLESRRVWIAYKNHKISTSEFDAYAKNIVITRCFPCIHNDVGKRKAYIFKKVFPNTFQVCDMSEVEHD